MTKYNFKTYSKIVPNIRDNRIRYDWCVFLDEEIEMLNDVAYVKYYLHPTFSNPEREISDRDSKFALYSNGWGNFTINIEVVCVNGEIYKMEYDLDLQENNWPITEINELAGDDSVIKVYNVIQDSDFNWRKLETIVSKSKLDSRVVLSSIDKLEEMNLVRKAHYKSMDKQDLFGITKKVGNEPR